MAKKKLDASRRPPGAPDDWEFPGPPVAKAALDVHDVTNCMLSLHEEVGEGSMPDGSPVRVLMHVNASCFWMHVGEGPGRSTYFISTKSLFQALMEAVEPLEKLQKSLQAAEKVTKRKSRKPAKEGTDESECSSR
jgi:hypothetical protein